MVTLLCINGRCLSCSWHVLQFLLVVFPFFVRVMYIFFFFGLYQLFNCRLG
eukprot:m.204763 g.204763  ORF g.204763 m.204763 type:complete len:51 (-) comp16886_c6_seq1:75-227(-)